MSMITLTLPSQERRTLVRSFWFALSALAAVPWLALAWWFHAAEFAAAALGIAVLVCLVPIVHQDFGWRVYRAWNPRLVRPLASIAARVLMAICFFVVVVATSRAGSRLTLAAPGGAPTSWVPRSSLPRDAYRMLFDAGSPGGTSGAWISDYLRWARQTGNLWSVSLLPFLAVLRLLPPDEDKVSQGNIYTLF